MFFFSEVDKRTFVVGDKIVNSTPDLVYCHSARILEAGPNLQKTLLFVVEVFISELTVVNIHIVSFSLLFLLRSSISTKDFIVILRFLFLYYYYYIQL